VRMPPKIATDLAQDGTDGPSGVPDTKEGDFVVIAGPAFRRLCAELRAAGSPAGAVSALEDAAAGGVAHLSPRALELRAKVALCRELEESGGVGGGGEDDEAPPAPPAVAAPGDEEEPGAGAAEGEEKTAPPMAEEKEEASPPEEAVARQGEEEDSFGQMKLHEDGLAETEVTTAIGYNHLAETEVTTQVGASTAAAPSRHSDAPAETDIASAPGASASAAGEPNAEGGDVKGEGEMLLDVAMAVVSEADMDKYRKAYALKQAVISGDTALVRGTWLFRHIREGNPLPKRQDCPPEALWNPSELVEVMNTSRSIPDGMSVPIVALSFGWETDEHPDPTGAQMRRVCCVVKRCLEQCSDVAIFIDWCSLWQQPRTEEQRASFERARQSIDLWYAHQMTWVWMLTSSGEGAANPAYDECGWTFFHRAISSLNSHYDMLLDIGRSVERCFDYSSIKEACTSDRGPPLAPAAFRDALAAKRLPGAAAEGEVDRAFLVQRYLHTFAAVMGAAESLAYVNQGFGASEAKQLSASLRWCTSLQVLSLDGNDIGEEGAASLGAALPQLCHLQGFFANRCGLGRMGAASIIAGAKDLRRLGGLYLSSNGINEEDAGTLEDAFLERHPRSVIRVS